MITFEAYASWMAASSAAIERICASAAAAVATAVSPVPKPPMMMLASDRFIASAISLVRMPPDAPTRAPATIRAQFPMTNPAIATAVPVNAFSSEITTGMSAPPIGSTIITPNASEASTTMSRAGRLAVVSMNAAVPIAITASAALSTRPPLKITGWSGVFSRRCARGDGGAGERDRADDHVEHGEDRRAAEHAAGGRLVVDVPVHGDERGRPAADRVEHRHQLRHRGHLDGPGRVQARHPPEQRPDDDHRPADPGDRAVVDQQHERDDHGDGHARHRDLVAAARGRGRVHQVQADDEARRRQDVDQLDVGGERVHARVPYDRWLGSDGTGTWRCDGGGGCAGPVAAPSATAAAGSAGAALRRNILSIRPVTA